MGETFLGLTPIVIWKSSDQGALYLINSRPAVSSALTRWLFCPNQAFFHCVQFLDVMLKQPTISGTKEPRLHFGRLPAGSRSQHDSQNILVWFLKCSLNRINQSQRLIAGSWILSQISLVYDTRREENIQDLNQHLKMYLANLNTMCQFKYLSRDSAE